MTRRLVLLLSHCCIVLAFSIFTFWTIGWHSVASQNYSMKRDCSFHHLFDPLPSGLCILEQRTESVLSVNRRRCLAMLRLQLLHSFQPFCSFCA
ncbi:hypothetical protein H5410_002797 [Solanum commersonii]|uniref:Uncharacterized protein n=1 Tax=Solanum commersonii TaxID=4109 RepID=A0A9J6B368_SOLCO|nr:hypothetical protein H5410_002797 [Solanum commersonii]